MTGRAIHERRPIRLRHIVMTTQAEADALGVSAVPVLGKLWRAADVAGINGPAGWVAGDYERRLIEEGKFTIRLPNVVGADGVDHVDRFAVISRDNYEIGDEWIEVWDGEPGNNDDGPLFVGSPDNADVSDGTIELTGFDALELMKTVRETLGIWTHSPRDVFGSYSRGWTAPVVEPFDDPAQAAVTVPILYTGTGTAFAGFVGGALRLRADADLGGHPMGFRSKTLGLTPNVAEQLLSGFRIETSVIATPTPAQSHSIQFAWGLGRPGGGTGNNTTIPILSATVDIAADGTTVVAWSPYRDAANLSISMPVYQRLRLRAGAPIALAIEFRNGWAYGFTNGELGAVMPYALDPAWSICIFADAFVQGPISGWRNTETLDFEYLIARAREPFLLRGGSPGSYRLPGAPQPGGLVGAYFDDRDLRVEQTEGFPPIAFHDPRHRLKPTRQPVARQIDPVLDWAPIPSPPGIPADHRSTRWIGAIYLDLAASDYVLRTVVVGGVRVWVGKTRFDQTYLSDWAALGARTVGPGGSLRTHLGTSESGWYPIVVEHFATGATGMRLQRATLTGGTPGTFAAVPSTDLSPQGVYEATVRSDSHYEQMQEMGRIFGYQWTLEPKSLESGLFPGELRPLIRVGADTDRIITTADLADGKPRRHLNARDVVQGLVLDAAGIATDGAQLSLEQLDFAELGRHLLIHEDAVSLSDITIPEVLQARARTLQVLRSSALEEVSFQPRGSNELVDLFPVAGALARLTWTPGLGVRLSFPRLRVDDTQPRQLTAVERQMTPQGLGPPGVSFRPRPRSTRAQLRALSRAVSAPRRTFQGQLGTLVGSWANGVAGAASRVPWPQNDDQVVGARLVVHFKSDASAWDVSVNGVVTGLQVTAAAPLDLSGYVAREGNNPRCYVQLTNGTGSIEYTLELRVRI